MTLEYTVGSYNVRFVESDSPETAWIRECGGEPWTGFVNGKEAGVVLRRPDEDSARAMVSCSLISIVEIPEDAD
jgi:hypothetical protein